eukprot:5060371-Prymnesium_polylepis.1
MKRIWRRSRCGAHCRTEPNFDSAPGGRSAPCATRGDRPPPPGRAAASTIRARIPAPGGWPGGAGFCSFFRPK